MTKTQDNLARDAARAAALIKATAEATATTLNIQYIQKDILEIKDAIKALVAGQDSKLDEMQDKIDFLSKMVYMGLGGLTVLSFGLKFFVK